MKGRERDGCRRNKNVERKIILTFLSLNRCHKKNEIYKNDYFSIYNNEIELDLGRSSELFIFDSTVWFLKLDFHYVKLNFYL